VSRDAAIATASSILSAFFIMYLLFCESITRG